MIIVNHAEVNLYIDIERVDNGIVFKLDEAGGAEHYLIREIYTEEDWDDMRKKVMLAGAGMFDRIMDEMIE